MRSLLGCAAVMLMLSIPVGCRSADRWGASPSAVGDARMAERVEDRIAEDQQMSGADIDVKADRGTVTLLGSVRSEEQKQRALELTRSVHGVVAVHSDLKVAPAGQAKQGGRGKEGLTGLEQKSEELAAQALREARKLSRQANAEVTDATITAQVKTMFAIDKDLKSLPLDVETDNGIVTLKGVIPDRGREERAVELAYSVEGVRGVKSTLKVRGPQVTR